MRRRSWLLLLSFSLVLVCLAKNARSSAAEPDWEWAPAVTQPGRIVGFDWSPDGGKLATTSSNSPRVSLWDAKTGQLLQTTFGPGMALNSSPEFSWDGKRVLGWAGNANKTTIWDTTTGKRVRTLLEYKLGVIAGSLNRDGTTALLASRSGALIWDVAGGEITKTIPVGPMPRSVAMSPDGKRGLVGLSDGSAALVDLVAGKVLHTLKGHTGEVNAVYLSQDGKRAVTGGRTEVLVWDAGTGAKVHTLTGEGLNYIKGVQISRDGKVVLANTSQDLFLWEGESGKLTRRQRLEGYVERARLNPEATKIAVGLDRQVVVVSVKTGERDPLRFGTISPALSLAWHPRDQAIAVGSESAPCVLWDLEKGSIKTVGNASPCQSIGWHEEGKQLYMANEGGAVALYDLTRPDTKARLFTPVLFTPTNASMTADGRLAIATEQKSITLWDTAKNERLKTLEAGAYGLRYVRWSPDGSQLLGANNDEIIVWETSKWSRVTSMPIRFGRPVQAEWSHDGKRIAACYGSFDDPYLYIWDAKTGKRLRTIEAETGPFTSISWNPDSSRLAVGSSDGQILIFDSDTRKLLFQMKGHNRLISQVSWSHNGKWLASTSHDGSTRLWDATTGKERGLLVSFLGGKEWLVLAPDGRFDGSEEGPRQQLYRKVNTSDLIAPEKYLRKKTPGLLGQLLER